MNSIELSVDKIYYFSSDLFNDYFSMKEPRTEIVVHGYEEAKIEQDTVLDYTVKVRKDVKILLDVSKGMYTEELSRERITICEKALGGAHYE